MNGGFAQEYGLKGLPLSGVPPSRNNVEEHMLPRVMKQVKR